MFFKPLFPESCAKVRCQEGGVVERRHPPLGAFVNLGKEVLKLVHPALTTNFVKNFPLLPAYLEDDLSPQRLGVTLLPIPYRIITPDAAPFFLPLLSAALL